jgi:hypothetical protein
MTCSVCGKPACGLICSACLEQSRRVFALLVVLFLSPVSHALNFGKPVSFGVAVDMSAPHLAAQHRLVLTSLLSRVTRVGDSVQLVRVCDKPATVAELKLTAKLSSSSIKALVTEATKPCNTRGSAITSGLDALGSKSVYLVLSDGGLTDDKRAGQFASVARHKLSNTSTRALAFFGLTGQRDSLKAQLPNDPRILTAGSADLSNAYAQLVALVKAGRR